VLAVIAPTVEIAERPAEAGPLPPASRPVVASTPGFDPIVTLAKRAPRVSRLAVRGPSAVRRAGVRPAVAAAKQIVRKAAQRERTRIATVRREARAQARARARVAEMRRASERSADRTVEPRGAHFSRRAEAPRKARISRRVNGVSTRMAAVIAYARAQVGKRYQSGGDGPNSFDCSGFTKRAYALAGLRLPHSSSGQAARARKISRAQARPGDLVYGPGHVGVYMGGGMMIDAGNRRTGVVFRRLYAGLQIARF
jgi:cell wall-associated NlpC family hydrolase